MPRAIVRSRGNNSRPPVRGRWNQTQTDENRRILTKPAVFFPRNRNIFVAGNIYVAYVMNMTSGQFKRWLAKQGCHFETGKGGHLIVRFGDKMPVLPMHGSRKEIGKGLENRIKKDLGLK